MNNKLKFLINKQTSIHALNEIIKVANDKIEKLRMTCEIKEVYKQIYSTTYRICLNATSKEGVFRYNFFENIPEEETARTRLLNIRDNITYDELYFYIPSKYLGDDCPEPYFITTEYSLYIEKIHNTVV